MILANGSSLSWLSLVAAAAYLLPSAIHTTLGARRALQLITAAWLLHGLVLTLSLLTDTPRFGFAPALSVTAWLVLG